MLHAAKTETAGQLNADRLASLIERAQRLDPDAYDAIIDAYGQRLFGFLYRLTGSREDAEDLLQEVFLRMVRTLGRYTHRGRFEAWLFRIAANLGRDRIRRVRRRPATLSLSLDPGDGDQTESAAWGAPDAQETSPDRSMMQREQIDRMRSALEQLPVAEREVVMLRHYSALSFAEIAEVMGTPLGTALARAHRGLAKLRRIMESANDR